jgi:hypothetical protein
MFVRKVGSSVTFVAIVTPTSCGVQAAKVIDIVRN